MRNMLNDTAIYIVNEAKLRDVDPMEIGAKVTRSLRIRSIDAETFFMTIWIARKYNLDDAERILEIKEKLSKLPEFEQIEHIISTFNNSHSLCQPIEEISELNETPEKF